MGQLSAITNILNWLKSFFLTVWQILVLVLTWIREILRRLWIWLRLHIPFLEAFVQRHVRNPTTVFIDLSMFVLTLYLIFGVTGVVMLYPKKSETRFTEVLTILYPLPAARVNHSIIWSHLFLQRLRFLNTFNKAAPSDVTVKPPTETELRDKVLAGLIEDQVIYSEAQKRGISVSVDELNQAYDAQTKQVDKLEEKIHQLYGMSIQEFKEIIAERLLKEKVKSAVITRIRIRHILVTTPQAATEAKKQLTAGADFSLVAKTYSQDSKTKDNGGDLGYWTKGELASQINQTFEDVAFKLTINATSDPIQTQYGYHIIQVTEKTGDNYQSYEEWYAGVLKNYKVIKYLKP